MVRRFNRASGLSVLYLRPAKWIVSLLLMVLSAATVLLFFNWVLAGVGFGIGLAGFVLASVSGGEFGYAFCEQFSFEPSMLTREAHF